MVMVVVVVVGDDYYAFTIKCYELLSFLMSAGLRHSWSGFHC